MTRPPGDMACKLKKWREGRVGCSGLMLELRGTPRDAGGGDGEHFGLVAGLPGDDQRQLIPATPCDPAAGTAMVSAWTSRPG